MTVVGVDGCRAGWFAVLLESDGSIRGLVLSAIDELEAVAPGSEVVAIDIPIGLPDGHAHRDADRAARQALGARRSSVFPAPQRAVLDVMDYAEACAVTREKIGKSVSKQAFAIVPKIAEVDRWVARTSLPVYEIHPEVSFRHLLGQPAGLAKRTLGGFTQRRDALIGSGLDINALLASKPVGVGRDDVLDAAVAAWSARRIAAGSAETYPEVPITAAGRPVAIWA